MGDGFYFTNTLRRAERYAYGITGNGKGKGENNVMSVYLNIKNPAISTKEYNEDIHLSLIHI